jgi:phage portal protein BeeE
MDKKQGKAIKLRDAGLTYREIAAKLKVSKSTVSNWCKPEQLVQKGLLNPLWKSDNDDQGPIDVYGAVSAPDAATLIKFNSDSVYICTDWCAKNVAKNPYKLLVKGDGPIQSKHVQYTRYTRKSPGTEDMREIVDHLALDLLEKPNKEMDKYKFLYYLDSMHSLCGDSFTFIRKEHYKRISTKEYENEGLPTSLWPLENQFLEPKNNGVEEGYLYNKNTPSLWFRKEDIMPLTFGSETTPYGSGKSPLEAVYERVLIQKNESAYLLSLFRNQARPDSIVTLKGGATADQCKRFQKQMAQTFRQGGIGGILAVDADDIDIKPLGWAPKDMLGSDLYKYTRSAIISAWSLNEALFTTENSNRATATEAERSAQKRALEPRVRLIETGINHYILPLFDERLRLEFDSPIEKDEMFDLERGTKLAEKLFPLQQAVYANQIPRDAAIQTAATLFSIHEQEAAKFFPQIG